MAGKPTLHQCFDSLLSWTASDLRKLLENGTYTSCQLIQLYLDMVDQHNTAGMQLHALISVVPRDQALVVAGQLDEERKSVEDTINTDPGLHMPTTLGSPALMTARPKGNAKIIDALIAEGAIILGKANLSEFGATKSGKAIPGYSPVGGQTQSAYIEGGVLPNDTVLGNSNPGGSSSGSAVGVAAGFSPWPIGAETDGSLMGPASRSSLYSIKPTVGRVSGDGVFMLTKSMDSLGGMAKSVEDLALLTDRLLLTSKEAPLQFTGIFERQWTKLKIGFLDPNDWKLPASLLKPSESYTRQTLDAYQSAVKLIQDQGAKVVFPVELTPAGKISYKGESAYSIIRNAEFRPQLNEYLGNLDLSPVQTLKDIIQYNADHPDVAFSDSSPNQNKLISMQEVDTSPEFLEEAIKEVKKAAGPDNIDRVLREHDLDVIIAPSDSPCTTVSAIAGYPIGTMPLGYLEENGRPFGLSILGSAHDEVKILTVMAAWEALMPRKIPPPLLKWNSKL